MIILNGEKLQKKARKKTTRKPEKADEEVPIRVVTTGTQRIGEVSGHLAGIPSSTYQVIMVASIPTDSMVLLSAS